MNIEDRFQVTVSAHIPDQSEFSICETCGAAVPRGLILLAGYKTMDCRQIHHDWHVELEEVRRMAINGGPA